MNSAKETKSPLQIQLERLVKKKGASVLDCYSQRRANNSGFPRWPSPWWCSSSESPLAAVSTPSALRTNTSKWPLLQVRVVIACVLRGLLWRCVLFLVCFSSGSNVCAFSCLDCRCRARGSAHNGHYHFGNGNASYERPKGPFAQLARFPSPFAMSIPF